MAAEHTIDWVGQQTKEWSNNHGSFLDYTVALAGEEGTVKLTQKPDTPAPSVGQQLYGQIETKHFDGHDGPFEVRKFRKEKREDGAAPNPQPRQSAVGRSGSDSPGPEFWAAKDRRLARAGMTQAVVSSPQVGQIKNETLDEWVARIGVITTKLLEDLEKRTPSPNQTSPATLDPSSGGSADASTQAPAGEQRAAPNTAPAPASSDLKLALAACGHDNANPEQTFKGLSPDDRGQVQLIVSNLKKKAGAEVPLGVTVTEPTTHHTADDEDVPF